MHQHFRSVATIAFAFGVFASACGSDEPETLSDIEFREQVAAIQCAGDAEIGAAIGAAFGDGEPTPDAMQEALDTVIAASRAQADAIEALAEPPNMTDGVEELLVEWRSATATAESQGLGFFESEGDPWARTGELADALGLGCGAA